MKRKVAQIGPSTLMVSLPTKWAKENGIHKGDELNVTTVRKEITFSVEENKTAKKEITVDISTFSSFMLIRYIETLYINNYNKIILTHSNQEILHNPTGKWENLRQRIKSTSNRFIGMEIVAQSTTMTELHCFLSKEEQDLESIGRRIFFLWKGALQELLDHIERDQPLSYKEVYEQHDNIIRFITYYLRVLAQSDLPELEKLYLFSFYLEFDKLVDKYRHLGEKVEQYGCTRKVKSLLQDVFHYVNEQFSMIHKGELNSDIIKKRYELVARIKKKEKFTIEELLVITEADLMLNVMNDIVRVVIVKKLMNVK